MPYALIAWETPDGVDADEVALAVITNLAAIDPALTPVQFLDQVALYPSHPGGVALQQVRQHLAPIRQAYQGINIMIIQPDEGAIVAGWFSDIRGPLAAARKVMNQPGSNTYPKLLPINVIP